jgi:hypothetical protein
MLPQTGRQRTFLQTACVEIDAGAKVLVGPAMKIPL